MKSALEVEFMVERVNLGFFEGGSSSMSSGTRAG
jgi:hypothetical protein